MFTQLFDGEIHDFSLDPPARLSLLQVPLAGGCAVEVDVGVPP